MTPRVFVSHSADDEALYSSLCLALDRSGISRWDVSGLTPGASLSGGLQAAIARCDVCVFLATARSIESRWCLAELGAFWGAGKKVIVYVADPALDESQLPPQFRGTYWTRDAAQLVDGIREAETGRVHRLSRGYSVRFGLMTVNVLLGRIEECEPEDDGLVALPANEFFDDECIHDERSTLGAFMQRHYPERIHEVQSLVKEALANEPTEEVSKRPGQAVPSFGIGTSVLLDRPLDTAFRVALVSVTTQRADEGLRATAADVLNAVASIHRLMANNRLRRLYVPLLGSGHGGLRHEVSLACLILAFVEQLQQSAYKIREVNIVVYRPDDESAAVVAEEDIRNLLEHWQSWLAG